MSLRYNNVSNFFYAIKSIQRSGNPFGFETDQNKVDIHMIKNSEWGVVAYLSQSKYGKYGNTKYNSTEKQVRINNCSNFTTGIGASSQDASQDAGVCTTAANKYDGDYGIQASTTGNITGVYDMNGGAREQVMGVLADEKGAPRSGNNDGNNSGFSGSLLNNTYSGIPFPNAKYYDLYVSKTTSAADTNINLSKTACNNGVCFGHALSETSGWYNDYSSFVCANYPWVSRSGEYQNSPNAGVFQSYTNTGGESKYSSSRAVFVTLGATS